MRGKLFAFEITAAAVLLPGFMVMPAIAADPAFPDNSGSDAASSLQPEDATTPVTPAHDIDSTRVTDEIRSALLGDDSLSPQAQHVIIATNPEAVVLSGSVKPEEKDRIESLAEQFAGARQIINELLVSDL